MFSCRTFIYIYNSTFANGEVKEFKDVEKLKPYAL